MDSINTPKVELFDTSLRDGLHLWSLKNAFMQIAGTITGQSRVPSTGPGLICE